MVINNSQFFSRKAPSFLNKLALLSSRKYLNRVLTEQYDVRVTDVFLIQSSIIHLLYPQLELYQTDIVHCLFF